MRFLERMGITVALSGALFAQTPLIYSRSIYNAASYLPAGVPAGAVARGSIFTLFGAAVGPATPVRATAFPLGVSLGGVTMTVTQGATTVNAIPLYVSAGQINAIMPSTAPIGTASLQVIYNNARSNLVPVRVATSAFGIFTANGTGIGPGILQNFIAGDNQPINSPTVVAQRGQTITLWGTGLGPVANDTVAPTAGNLPVQVEVSVGGVAALVAYSGRTPCCSGTDQIAFRIPDNAPYGCWVPVYIRTAGTTVSNVVTMAIGPNANACTVDVFPDAAALLVSGGKLGGAVTFRVATRHDGPTRAIVDAVGDYHSSLALPLPKTAFPFNPFVALPPAGTCTAYAAMGDFLKGSMILSMIPSSGPLDLGPAMQLTGPLGSRALTSLLFGGRAGLIGGSISGNLLPSTLFLEPGSYSIAGLGSGDVGPFTAAFNVPQPLVWTGRDLLASVDRTQPLAVAWTGGDANQTVVVAGFGEDLPTNSSAMFVCVAPRGASSFAVPAVYLSNLPATRANPLQTKGVVYVASIPDSGLAPLAPSGLDKGVSLFTYINGKSVVIR